MAHPELKDVVAIATIAKRDVEGVYSVTCELGELGNG